MNGDKVIAGSLDALLPPPFGLLVNCSKSWNTTHVFGLLVEINQAYV